MTATASSGAAIGGDQPRYWDDVEVGERVRSAGFEFSREAIFAFARQYDPQPMHLSEEGAAKSFFGELIASGWQTACVTFRLMVDARPLGSTPLVGLEIKEMKFERPVRPGDQVYAEGEVLERRASKTRPERGVIVMRVVTMNQKDQPVMSQLWVAIMPTRLGAAGP
ncbi:MaoC family dehydratase [Hypericibacter sp.]|uniref:MaoC family dehydratase n=1 Tax=Hypericibacter sp. TaxID=2705401 RepID=UPI003D6C9E78